MYQKEVVFDIHVANFYMEFVIFILFIFQFFRKNAALGYMQLRQYDKALEQYLIIYEKEPDDPQNLFLIAKSSVLSGAFEVCKNHCAILKERCPDDAVLIPQVITVNYLLFHE